MKTTGSGSPGTAKFKRQTGRKRRVDIIYAEGPGDIVSSFRQWRKQEKFSGETSETFSSQFFDFCQRSGMTAYALSHCSERDLVRNDQFVVENNPKTALGPGLLYHLSELLYGLKLFAVAFRCRPKYAIINSGVTHWFVLFSFRFLDIKVIVSLHNTLWPRGFRPQSVTRRMVLKSYAWFWKRTADATMCISPECERQIRELIPFPKGKLYQFRPQYRRGDFEKCGPAPGHNARPFGVVFAGRIESDKGVFDLIEIAGLLKDIEIRFEICGTGSAVDALRSEIERRKLTGCIQLHGRLTRSRLIDTYSGAHLTIIPTRSEFNEGLAMVAAESILANRPILTSRVVPALEILKPAALEAEPDNPESYAFWIREVFANEPLYRELCQHCDALKETFFDGTLSLANVLHQVITDLKSSDKSYKNH